MPGVQRRIRSANQGRRRAGAEFLESYQDEIRAMATDVLLNHYLGEHVLDGDPDGGQDKGGQPRP